uniref:F-box domain-containing protein n=1 Tax=Graphocephala atropunctata TaxID=36148 RepID=A0A1B6L7J0_9HEMI
MDLIFHQREIIQVWVPRRYVMESTETEVLTSLEDLPLDAVELITNYLTLTDLAACCAVSRGMREVFDDDVLWRRHCDRELAEHLRTTPCRVEPPFVSPEIEESTLSPVGYWRMSFMRENHLYNNWRLGRFKKEFLVDKGYNKCWPYSIGFLTNDIMALVTTDRINILDVKSYPAVEAVEPIYLFVGLPYTLQMYYENNMIVIMYGSSVQVYHLDFSTKQSFLNHVFFFESPEKIRNIFVDFEHKFSKNKHQRFLIEKLRLIVEKYFVGILPGEFVMHVWDLEKGVKVKTENLPISKGLIQAVKGSDSKLVVIAVVGVDPFDQTYLVYNLTDLRFLPFRHKDSSSVEFYVVNDYIGFWVPYTLSLYNLRTSEMILQCNAAAHHPMQNLGNHLYFVQHFFLTVVSPKNKYLKCELLTDTKSFKILTKKFVRIQRSGTFGVWEMNGNKKLRKIAATIFASGRIPLVNKSSTRCILTIDRAGAVVHYW